MDPHTSSLSLFRSLTPFCPSQSLFLSLSITHMSLDAVLSSLSVIYRGKKQDKLMKGTDLPLAMWHIQHREVPRHGSRWHLWLCGIATLFCFLHLGLEVPMPMQSQHRKSSATIFGRFQAQGLKMVANQQRVIKAN